MQTIIVGVVLVLSVAYLVCRLRRVVRSEESPCAHCDGCALQEEMLKNRQKVECTKKK